MTSYYIDKQWIGLKLFEEILASNCSVYLSDKAMLGVQQCHDYLAEKIEDSAAIFYGINTGFGSLCDTMISKSDLLTLQRNLLVSHACGMGEEVPKEIVRRMLLLKVMGLSQGYSGVQVETIQRLLFFYNKGIYPVIYQQGSLGASGDLAPLAHLSLPLIGEGEVEFENTRYSGEAINKKFNLAPITLHPKEGLALLNGTQFMSAYATYAIHKSYDLWNKWNHIAALSLEGFDAKIDPFNPGVHALRHQLGQIETAKVVRELLAGSQLINQPKIHVQDPYSFRCIPQVHGATKDTIDHCSSIVEREINAVTDNPMVLHETDEIVSAGNFHGQPLALILDYLAIALSELGSISERRTYKLISGNRGLPAFLIANPGLNSGLMIVHYTCASIVSQNKQLCTPASVDTIDSSNGQEDHVSMGANAATKLFRIIENCYSIMGIELINATQAMEFRKPLKTSISLELLMADFRVDVAKLELDRTSYPDMQLARDFVINKMKI
ncbi:MAG: histidine ammonia-lyase [Crocinitomicaceae bacterium]|nr:histidine ammonia-lyase [Crocinitomicaceae bacterium]